MGSATTVPALAADFHLGADRDSAAERREGDGLPLPSAAALVSVPIALPSRDDLVATGGGARRSAGRGRGEARCRPGSRCGRRAPGR